MIKAIRAASKKTFDLPSHDRALRTAISKLLRRRGPRSSPCMRRRDRISTVAAGDPRARQEGRRVAQSVDARGRHQVRARQARPHSRHDGEPGFGGQAFILSQLEKIAAFARWWGTGRSISKSMAVSHPRRQAPLPRAGANVLVAGSAVFKGGSVESYRANIAAIRKAAETGARGWLSGAP